MCFNITNYYRSSQRYRTEVKRVTYMGPSKRRHNLVYIIMSTVLTIHRLASNWTDLRYTIYLINHFTNIEDIGRNSSVLLYRGHSVGYNLRVLLFGNLVSEPPNLQTVYLHNRFINYNIICRVWIAQTEVPGNQIWF